MGRRGTALIAIGLAVLAGGGCVSTDYSPEPDVTVNKPSPSPTVDQSRDELLQALRRTEAAAYRFRVRGQLPEGQSIDSTGTFDPKARAYSATTKITGGKNPTSVQQIVVRTDSYTREPGDKTWVHLDLKRAKPSIFNTYDLADPTGLTRFIAAMGGAVRQTEPGTYTGAFDASGSNPFLPVGAPAVVAFTFGMTPFTATTDERGWVTSIALEFTQSDSSRLVVTTTLSGHGSVPRVKAPPKSAVLEADDMYYR